MWSSTTGPVLLRQSECHSHLLPVDGIVGQLRQMDELQVEGSKLGQDAAPSWGPAPTPAGSTAAETSDNASEPQTSQ